LRVIILDEVHMLSTAAWNALLKVLEEPPAHVRYVFATTEVDKVLPTVLSRCQRFDFRPISIDIVADTLAAIASKEGADLPEVVRLRIARVSGGGMRDAQQLLDQLLAVSEGTPSEDDLDLLLGAARSGDVAQLMERLAAGDRGGALALLDGVLAAGVAASTLIEQLIDHSRAVLLFQAIGAEAAGFRRIGVAADTAQTLAGMLPGEKVLRICQLLIGAQQALRQGVDARLQLELTCVRIAGLGRLVDLEALLKRIERAEATSQARP
jgi:DNA polymerase-3 subunit gamma/tau